ncbi:hypothetical protein [Psychrobacter sp. UBA3480]|uniref:hypothetical protein n=1 Tax=Psychrobacter sp. UBA3480 TaxID=1947350 RepID=UPI0025DB6FD0|nr:hypothetical protein [Psychrobacter sp. UBA3480]
MKTHIKKSPVKSSKSKYFYISLFIVASTYTVLDTAMHWKLTPSQEEMQYTFGLVGVDSNDGIATISVLPSATLKDQITFGCAYSMKADPVSNQCLDASLLAPIKGSVATVGWYKLKSVLGYKNSYPQMVSLEVNGKYIKSYNETRVINEGYNQARGLLTCLTLLIYFVMLQFILFFNRKRSEKNLLQKT